MDLLLTALMMNPVVYLVILIVMLLIFGKRLPEIAKSLGKGIVEFKKGLKGVEDEIDRQSSSIPPPNQHYQGQYPQQYPQGQPGQYGSPSQYPSGPAPQYGNPGGSAPPAGTQGPHGDGMNPNPPPPPGDQRPA